MAMLQSLKTFYINLSDKKYPIVFGEGAVASIDAKDIGDATRALIVTNGMVSDHCADLSADIQSQIDIEVDVLILPEGSLQRLWIRYR